MAMAMDMDMAMVMAMDIIPTTGKLKKNRRGNVFSRDPNISVREWGLENKEWFNEAN
jgi:hypothetical protein